MKNEKPYVKIHSNVTIQVTPGLQNEDVTNPDAHVPDRLKISPVWPTGIIMIKEGQHIYPSEILEWNTVKALAKEEIITIGQGVDTAEGEIIESKNKLSQFKKDKEDKKEEVKKEVKLSEIAGEED